MPAFTVKRKQAGRQPKEEKSKWDCFNLIPNEKLGYADNVSYRYRLKTLCNIAAPESIETQDWLFDTQSQLKVYEIIMFKKARDYELHS